MKTDIITFHFVNNFGGVLQAYALQKAIEDNCEADAEIIDYRNGFIRFTDTVRLFPVSSNPKEIISGLKTMGKRFGRIKRFKTFRNENLHLTSKRYSHFRLKTSPPEADSYICGSDQIWNPFLTFGLKGAYVLDFSKEGHKKIAYAPSFGNSQLSTTFKKKMQSYLSDFDAISVREKTGIDIIRNLVSTDVKQLIDPTFLLSREEWDKTAEDMACDKPYLLLYIMQSDKAMYDYARVLKEKLGLRIVEISRYGFNPGFIDETLVDVGPKEFLGLFKNADYICTNSYHGFVFSLIFEKNFCLIPCKRFRTRIYNLAEMLNIRVVETSAEDAGDTEYDKENVMNRIRDERRIALEWLSGYSIMMGEPPI